MAGNKAEAFFQFRLQPYVMAVLQWIGSLPLPDAVMYDQSSQRAPTNQLAHRESQLDSKTASTLGVGLPSKNISQTVVWRETSHIGQSHEDFPNFIARTRQGAITYSLGSPANDTSLLLQRPWDMSMHLGVGIAATPWPRLPGQSSGGKMTVSLPLP
jgi:hypothetical protein